MFYGVAFHPVNVVLLNEPRAATVYNISHISSVIVRGLTSLLKLSLHIQAVRQARLACAAVQDFLQLSTTSRISAYAAHRKHSYQTKA
jgi:hypothetical protein